MSRFTQLELEEGGTDPHPKARAELPPVPGTPSWPRTSPAGGRGTCSSSLLHCARTCHEQIAPRSCHASRRSGRDFLAVGSGRKRPWWGRRAEQGGNCYRPWKKVRKHRSNFCTSRMVWLVKWELPPLGVNLWRELSSFLRV